VQSDPGATQPLTDPAVTGPAVTDPAMAASAVTDPGVTDPALTVPAVSDPARRRSASLAAVLSFLWPGLGQLYRGRRWSALVYAVPPALILLGIAAVAAGGLERLALRLLNPPVALTATALVAIIGLWRIVSIFDARRRTAIDPPESHSRRSLVVAMVLAVLVIAVHGFAGYYAFSFYRAGQQIQEPLIGAQPSPEPTQDAGGLPTATPDPDATPGPTEPPPSEMINVLFVGIDRGLLINTNTDTMLLASFNPQTQRIVMISLPRDTAQMPLYNGGTWDRKINSLYHYAANNPDEFPDGGMGTLVREFEYLIGVPIDYYASIEMAGFWGMIDKVGGVDVVLERPINDPVYTYHDKQGFYLEAGPHHLDGATALAYVRSRHGPGNSDFERARRQQQLILALRERLRDPSVLLNMPSLLDAAGEFVRTDAPLDRLPELLDIVQASQGAEVEHIVLGPRTFAERIPFSEFNGQYGLRLKMEEVAALSISLFGDESRYVRDGVPSTRKPMLTADPV
jgi:LCP family protein required for cell wall assembly